MRSILHERTLIGSTTPCVAAAPTAHRPALRRPRLHDSAAAAQPQASAPAAFGEEEYFATAQSKQREAWAAQLRAAEDRGRAAAAAPPPLAAPVAAAAAAAPRNAAPAPLGLDPPPRLAGVSIVLVEPLRPRTVGTVARLCSCVEALDLKLVAPRCDHVSRPALSASKGAQFVLRGASVHASLAEALQAAGATGVAFTRWAGAAGTGPRVIEGVGKLLAAPEVARALSLGANDSSSSGSSGSSALGSSELSSASEVGGSSSSDGPGASRLALVFGREEFGLSDSEVCECALACALPMGRLAESLSLSHAAAIALGALFCAAAESGSPQKAGSP